MIKDARHFIYLKVKCGPCPSGHKWEQNAKILASIRIVAESKRERRKREREREKKKEKRERDREIEK